MDQHHHHTLSVIRSERTMAETLYSVTKWNEYFLSVLAMSLLNIGLQGMALEREHTGEFEKMFKSCNSMKSLQTRAKQQQGLKEIYLESLNAPINILESTLSNLELTGKPLKIFKPCRDSNEVIQALQKVSS